MDFQRVIDQAADVVGSFVPNLLGALGILVVGWIVALIVAAVVRGILKRTSVDNRLASFVAGKDTFGGVSIEQAAAKTAFYVLMLFVLVAFFQALGLTIVTNPLNAFLLRLTEFAPQLLGALLLLGIALIVATVVRVVVSRSLSAIGLEKRLGDPAGPANLSTTFGDVTYWLVLLLFLPGILGALELQGMLEPVRELTSELLGFLPNLFAAALILLVGWFAAALVGRIVLNLLKSAGADQFATGVGLAPVLGRTGLSGFAGTLVQALVLIPIVIAALNALQLDAVTTPASEMLARMLSAVPALFAATLLVGISFVVGKIVAGLVARTLSAAGFNRLPVVLGMAREAPSGVATPSSMAGTLTLTAVMLFAAIEGARMLGFEQFANLISSFLVLTGQIVLAIIVFGVGLYLASLAAKSVGASRTQHSGLLATLARTAIILFAGSMALRATGLANEIVDLAFGLTFGAVAVAAALAFGLGSRETAGRLVEGWAKQFQNPKP